MDFIKKMIQIFHQNIIVKSFRYLLYRCLDSFDFLMNNFMDKFYNILEPIIIKKKKITKKKKRKNINLKYFHIFSFIYIYLFLIFKTT
ncbi:hypothetical protein PFMALIP_00359 [Plasmodium falciparum MaliPS096_E11]|uniref:Uncharacterized protein n=1 Tax=Plasmodium falciparum MaliPS096_E11 TaxID=1036727 RepID=A0A024WWQ1_PLAFA|nr:hypothetical protein PFMALIP_00359 [Plasmodium falciparum MaliPS096_E11]